MGRRSKYTPEIAEQIFQSVRMTGSDRAGYESVGISEDTFYRWVKKYPEFSEGLARARSEFRKICPEVLQLEATKRLAEALKGQKIERIIKRKLRREHRMANGTPVWFQTEEEEVVKQDRLPPARWAIERVIPKPIHDLDNLLAVAEEYGLTLVVKDRDLFNRYLTDFSSQESDAGRGLSDETIAQIRSQILGIDDEYEDIE